MDNDTLLSHLSPAEILALTIYGESRGERIEGQIAVGCVIRNRLLLSPKVYQSYHDVCLAKLQFSCWNEDDPNRPVLLELANTMILGQYTADRVLKQCLWIAKGIEDWSILDNVNSSTHYLTTDLFDNKRPSWARVIRSNPVDIGHHVFFNV
jgi:spore germination cell wall hydrolase CwlJ-like protein